MSDTPQNFLKTLEEATTYAYALEELLETKEYQQNAIIEAKHEAETKKAHDFFYWLRNLAILLFVWVAFEVFVCMSVDTSIFNGFVFIPLAFALLLTVLSAVFIRKGKKRVEESEKQLPEKLKNLQDELDEIENKIKILVSEISNSGLLNIIPRKYFNTATLVFFQKSVENKMADNLKECILLFEQEIKHQEMLSQQAAIAEYQSAQLDELVREVELNNILTVMNSNKS